jgi:hypothetical protein
MFGTTNCGEKNEIVCVYVTGSRYASKLLVRAGYNAFERRVDVASFCNISNERLLTHTFSADPEIS